MVLEKVLERIKVWIVILVVVVVSMIAFWGIFLKDKGIWKNVVPDYEYGMQIEGARELRYVPDNSEAEKYVYVDENGAIKGEVWKDGSPTTAEEEAKSAEENADVENTESETEEISYAKEMRSIKVNSDDKLTKENFEKTKKLIQKRLKSQQIPQYNIRIDDVTGKLVIETANDDTIETVENLIASAGKFQIIDYQNGLVLMDNSDIKKASVVSSNTDMYNTYLQIEFNKEGAEKLREISTKYVEIKKDEQTENVDEQQEGEEDNHEEETQKKYVSIVFDNTTMMTTYFGEEMTAGILQISVGKARAEQEEFLEDYQSAKRIADILNSGVLPVTYQLETDNFVKAEYTKENVNALKMIAVVAIALASIILVVRFKKNGVLGAILAIGYIATLSIVARYTNVVITENSMIAYAIVIIMNYIFVKMLLKMLQTQEIVQAYSEVMKKFYLVTIPVDVIAIVFTFSKYTTINSIGMVLFWGIILNVLYHFILTRNVLKKQK